MISRKVILLISYFLFITVPSAVRRPPSAIRIRRPHPHFTESRVCEVCLCPEPTSMWGILARKGSRPRVTFSDRFNHKMTERRSHKTLLDFCQPKFLATGSTIRVVSVCLITKYQGFVVFLLCLSEKYSSWVIPWAYFVNKYHTSMHDERSIHSACKN